MRTPRLRYLNCLLIFKTRRQREEQKSCASEWGSSTEGFAESDETWLVSRIMAPKGVLTLRSGAWEYVTFTQQKGTQHMWLRTLRRRDDPGHSRWAQCIPKGPYRWKRKAGERESQRAKECGDINHCVTHLKLTQRCTSIVSQYNWKQNPYS